MADVRGKGYNALCAIGKRELHASACFLLRIRLRRPEGFRQSQRVACKGTGNHLKLERKN